MKKPSQPGEESGNAILEFALVMSVLVPLFAGMFSIGMTLSKGIQVSNVCQDAVVLMVRSNTDPNSGLDLSQTQNQRIIVRAATGLGMNSDAQFNPSPTGKGVVILTKVVMVGPQECAAGVEIGRAHV
jgi:Flp pilus assembly protein TadG